MRQVCHGRDKCFELTRLWVRGIILIFTSFLRTSRSNQSCEHPGNCRPIQQSLSRYLNSNTQSIQDSCLLSLMVLIVFHFPKRKDLNPCKTSRRCVTHYVTDVRLRCVTCDTVMRRVTRDNLNSVTACLRQLVYM